MTTALAIAGVLLVALLAYRLWKLPQALAARGVAQSLGALKVGGIVDVPLADQPAALPWVASLSGGTQTTTTRVTLDGTTESVPVVRGAGDWYDPTVETVEQTFNEFGFITSPSPAPVNPATGAVPMTNADVCAWIGHVIGTNPCSRCGVQL